METKKVLPRQVKSGDTLVIESLDDDLSIRRDLRQVTKVETMNAGHIYRLRLSNGETHYVSPRQQVEVLVKEQDRD